MSLCIFLLFALCLSGSFAESSGSGLTWHLTEAGVLTISGTGEMTEHPWTDSASKIRQAVVSDGILNICENAFYNCTNLEDITLSDTVNRIEANAFRYCTHLTDVTLPEAVTTIEEYAFYGSGLTKIKLNEGLAEIGTSAFGNCTSLPEIIIPQSVTHIDNNAFRTGVTLYAVPGSSGAKALGKASMSFQEQGGKYIYRYRFAEDQTENLVLEKTVNKNIESVSAIHADVTVIGNHAFENCLKLKSAEIPSGIKSIEYCAFLGCSNLKSTTIPDSLEEIGYNVFPEGTAVYARVGSLGAKTLGKSHMSFQEQGGKYVYQYRFDEDQAEELLLQQPVSKNIESATDIHEDVTVIGAHAFENCIKLKNVTIPAGVNTIVYYAFSGCKNLESVSFPSDLKTIESYAFSGCEKLESINVPENLEELAYGAFPEATVYYAGIGSEGAKALGRSHLSFRPTGNDTVLLHYIYENNQLKGLELKQILKPHSTVKVPDGVTTFGNNYTGPLKECADKVTCLELPDSISSLRMSSFAGARRTFYIKCNKNSYAESFAKNHGMQYKTESANVIGCDITGVDEKVNWIISHYIFSGMSEYQKVKVINNWLICNAHYDYTYAANDAAGVLIQGVGVCESYARAAQKLLDKAGIENMYLRGTADNGTGGGFQDHAWNLVKVNGSWYHLDTTWNDPAQWNDPAAIGGFERYKYFLLTSAQIGVDHRWSTDIPSTGPQLDEETDDGLVDINGLKFSNVKDQIFTGKAIKPAVVIKDGKTRLKPGEDYKLSYKSNKAVGKATITVTGQGKYKGTRKLSFRIVPASVNLKNLKAGKGKLTVTWQKGVKVDGYEIEYSLKKNFKSSDKVTISKGTVTKKAINKLKSGKKYYVRVRAWKKVKGENYYSAWSNVLNGKTK